MGTGILTCACSHVLRGHAQVVHEATHPMLQAVDPVAFAGSLASIPDMDGDGQQELAVRCTH